MSAPVDGDDDGNDGDDDDDDYDDDSVDNENDDEKEEKKINLRAHPNGWHVDKFRLAFIVKEKKRGRKELTRDQGNNKVGGMEGEGISEN